MTRLSGRRRLQGEQGATALELALIAPLLLSVVGGLLLFGLYAVYGGLADYAAKQAVRYASIPDARSRYPDAAAVGGAAERAVPDLLGRPARVDVCPPDCSPPCPAGARPSAGPGRSCSVREGQTVTVTVTWDVPVLRAALLLVPFIATGADDGVVARSASRRRE